MTASAPDFVQPGAADAAWLDGRGVAIIDPRWFGGSYAEIPTRPTSEPIPVSQTPAVVLAEDGSVEPLPVPPPFNARVLLETPDSVLLAGWRCADGPADPGESGCMQRLEAVELSADGSEWQEVPTPDVPELVDPDISPARGDTATPSFWALQRQFVLSEDRIAELPPDGLPGTDERFVSTCITGSVVMRLHVDVEDRLAATGDAPGQLTVRDVQLYDLSAEEPTWVAAPVPAPDSPASYLLSCVDGTAIIPAGSSELRFDVAERQWSLAAAEVPPELGASRSRRLSGPTVTSGDQTYVGSETQIFRRSPDGRWEVVADGAGALVQRPSGAALIRSDPASRSPVEIAALP